MHFNNNHDPTLHAFTFIFPAANSQFVSHLHFDGFILCFSTGVWGNDDLQYATENPRRTIRESAIAENLLQSYLRFRAKKFFNHDTTLNQAESRTQRF